MPRRPLTCAQISEFNTAVIEAQGLPVVTSGRVERLPAALQPVLAYHARGKLPTYVLESARAKAYFVESASLSSSPLCPRELTMRRGAAG